MKFLSGFILGILATTLSLFVVFTVYEQDTAPISSDSLYGLTTLSEKGGCIIKNEVEIFQTIRPNAALATSGRIPNEMLALIINHDGDIYYDKQKIKMPPNKCARQIGTYRYETNSGVMRTVPAVVIE